MYIQVQLLNGFTRPLYYKMPSTLPATIVVGTIVSVPLRNRTVPAIVMKQLSSIPHTSFEIKECLGIEPFPNDQAYKEFIAELGYLYTIPSIHFIKRVRQFLVEKTDASTPPSIQPIHAPTVQKGVQLTDEQQQVYQFVAQYLHTPCYAPTLLHGVTGSGKTEVYKKLIINAIAANKTVILLLPEVTLAIQFQKILMAQLPETIHICGFHSAISIKEKRLLWQRLLEEKPTVIVGVHLPILLPIANLGLIIIDEEHETGYQEKRHPKINSRHAALLRAQIAQIPILLGSATPSISSLYQVKTKQWKFFQLKKRFAGQLPTVQIVPLTTQNRRANFWISTELEAAIAERLTKKEQIIIFLNRRGFSFFVQCTGCSFIFSCPHCSVSLTLHTQNTEQQLNCHYCAFTQELPTACPSCKVDAKKFLKKGIGTQQVVTILQTLFPTARIARADLDTTTKKKTWQKTVHDFENNELDILVGTQTVTKGFHFPHVTLVGVLWADLNLHFPIFNATETTLQQLIQVAGRAGRSTTKSDVIIQAMMDHHVYDYLNEIDYLKFYATEIEKRTALNYPPYGTLIEVEMKHTDEAALERESYQLLEELDAHNQDSDEISILGPAKPPVYKIKTVHMRTLFIKSPSIQKGIALVQKIKRSDYASQIFFTPIF
ncbi:MAG TPA: primosomal protein N' [Candidatus Babeliales bacterium]|nr:primosomal protein N' [Candidatus Babeliales bacterium]